MQMKKTILSVMLACVAVVDAAACTSAIISGSLTADGRPILWKHRDTSDLNNNRCRRKNSLCGAFQQFRQGMQGGLDGNERCWVCHNEHGVLQSEERHGLGNG
jgi:hypothetical protein